MTDLTNAIQHINVKLDSMTKKFGASCINREMFMDCFDYPIDMSQVSDDVMQELANTVEGYLRDKYGQDADEMFALWSKEDFTDNDSLKIASNYIDVWNEYWQVLGNLSNQACELVANGGEV